jgi:hypothetical protein
MFGEAWERVLLAYRYQQIQESLDPEKRRFEVLRLVGGQGETYQPALETGRPF